tara:strand:- start:566 stop:808 length:243 start_codon:yes stop_codon:yes gene_type:complete
MANKPDPDDTRNEILLGILNTLKEIKLDMKGITIDRRAIMPAMAMQGTLNRRIWDDGVDEAKCLQIADSMIKAMDKVKET